MDPRSSPEILDDELLKDLGVNVIFAAEVAHDSGKSNFDIQKCSVNIQHRKQTLEGPDGLNMLLPDERFKMTEFHDTVVRPLVRWFLAEFKKGDTPEAGPSRKDYYSAFYYYQSACNIADSYPKRTICRNANTYTEAILMIPAELCGESERRALMDVITWVNAQYRELIAKGRERFSIFKPHSLDNILCNLVAMNGLKHLHQYCLQGMLNMAKLEEADNRWKEGWAVTEPFVLATLKKGIEDCNPSDDQKALQN